MATVDGTNVSLTLGKFRGCMAGALLGDCLGAPFEDISLSQFYFSHLNEIFQEQSDLRKTPLHYTDDTVLTWSLARSLIDRRGFDAKDVAQKMTEDYFKDRYRTYGIHVVDVFAKLHRDNYRDIFTPAREQFDGRGSYGNGAAMKIAPLALLLHRRPDELRDKAEECARLTHTHPVGFGGAVLQSLAVAQAVLLRDNPDPARLISDLLDLADFPQELVKKLEKVEEMASRNRPPAAEEVVSLLGAGISAADSVPTALYCFLRSFRPLDDRPTDNGLERALYHAISLGGDTDTIASMAGAIAGAFYGIEPVSFLPFKFCENWESALSLADGLHQLAGDLKML